MHNFDLKFENENVLTPYLEEVARRELRETEENVKKGLEKLRQLIAKEENFHIPTDEYTYLMAFLRTCKFYPESAFQKMRSFFKFKEKNPKYCADLYPSQERNVFVSNMFTVLTQRDQFGRRVLIAEAGDKWNTQEVSLPEIYKCIQMILEAAIAEPRTQIAGCIMVVDLQGLNANHIWQFSPGFAKMVLDWQQDCLPVRLKAIHVVNQPYIFNMLFQVFKPFLREKLRKRIFFHGTNTEGLLKHIDAKCVPKKYGGDSMICLENGLELWKLMCQYDDDFSRTNSFGYLPSNKTKHQKEKEKLKLVITNNNNNEELIVNHMDVSR